MSKPTDLAWSALKRLGRYLKARPRMVFNIPFQICHAIDVYSNTDWAGCLRTRKSTSGGCVVMGSHVTKAWSATQASVSLSSGEAEYYGVVRAAGIGLGILALLRDAGVHLPLRVWTDSESAMCTAGRQGLGELRHLECHSLWLQQRLRRKELTLLKVPGVDNPADLFTKHFESSVKLDQLLGKFNCRIMEGRPAAAPQLKKAALPIRGGSAIRSLGSSEAQRASERMLPHIACGGDTSGIEVAVPDEPIIDEPDDDRAEGLGDPVPRLARDPATNRRRGQTRQMTKRSLSLDRSRMKGDGSSARRALELSQVRSEAARGEKSTQRAPHITHARSVTVDSGPGVREEDTVVAISHNGAISRAARTTLRTSYNQTLMTRVNNGSVAVQGVLAVGWCLTVDVSP